MDIYDKRRIEFVLPEQRILIFVTKAKLIEMRDLMRMHRDIPIYSKLSIDFNKKETKTYDFSNNGK